MKKKDVKTALKAVPEPMALFTKEGVRTIDGLFPGVNQAQMRETLRTKGVVKYKDNVFALDVGPDGTVLSMAAAVSRTPTKSDTYLNANVPDLDPAKGLSRKESLALYKSISKNEGIVSNAISKKGALISQDGAYSVRSARQGKRQVKTVAPELLTLLHFWATNVNAATEDAAITGSRGVKQVVRRGSRQAMIDGDLFLRQVWTKIAVPELGGKKYALPMTLQALPTEEVEIAEELIGLGIELYYWVPERTKINKILNSRNPLVKAQIDKLLAADVVAALRRDGRYPLDPSLIIHIKHAGTDTDAYGQSDVASALTDIAYSRALKSLDFVTIDSLINRMVIVKIGDENPASSYHNLATAQARTNTFARLLSEVGPNMFVLWAGHDVETLDLGAHNSILDTNKRQEMASSAVKLATGVPEPLLTGNAEGGNAVAWAGFVSLAAVAAELQEEWAQALTQLGKRMAEENKFKDVDVTWDFSHRLLADKEANSKVMLQLFDRGGLSYRSVLEELGKDYDVEKARLSEEMDAGDEELFKPRPIATGGPGGEQGVEPESQPGRPTRKESTKIGPERQREERTLE